MKSRYKRKAWYLDEDILIQGYTDKRGFHPGYGIQCGFDTQEFTKRDIGKKLFYSLNEALITCCTMVITVGGIAQRSPASPSKEMRLYHVK